MDKYKHSIIIIVTYCGEFPWYFRFFLESCRLNSSIDFLLVTDCRCEWKLPENLRTLQISLEDINQLATQTTGIKTNIINPYKLCDFKPAYGCIFSRFIDGYDFWGQCDIDVIFGSIRRFLNEQILDLYDFVSVRHDYTTGCFGLYRNNSVMNSMFLRSRDIHAIYSSSKHYCFDECNFAHTALGDGIPISEIDTEIETLTHIIKKAMTSHEIKAYFDFIMLEGTPGKIRYNHGQLIYNNKFEVMLYHLYWLKKVYNPAKDWRRFPTKYSISSTRIYI